MATYTIDSELLSEVIEALTRRCAERGNAEDSAGTDQNLVERLQALPPEPDFWTDDGGWTFPIEPSGSGE